MEAVLGNDGFGKEKTPLIRIVHYKSKAKDCFDGDGGVTTERDVVMRTEGE